jgi:hypothetical protein
MQMFQELQPSDHEKKMTYCLWFNRTMDKNLLDLSFFNDEAWFQQNMQTLGADNPHFL